MGRVRLSRVASPLMTKTQRAGITLQAYIFAWSTCRGQICHKARYAECGVTDQPSFSISIVHQTLHNDDDDEQQPFLKADRTAAIPLENKVLAFRALKQGLKFHYENWR